MLNNDYYAKISYCYTGITETVQLNSKNEFDSYERKLKESTNEFLNNPWLLDIEATFFDGKISFFNLRRGYFE